MDASRKIYHNSGRLRNIAEPLESATEVETPQHTHEWRRTGEFFACSPPIWIVVCACGAAGEQLDDRSSVTVMQTSGCEKLPGAMNALSREPSS
jgi:hypothetical protein